MQDVIDRIPGHEKPGNPPTICKECRFIVKADVAGDAYCSNRRFAIQPAYDYVTGKIPPATWPYCRDINTEGKCPGFEKRRGFSTSDLICGALVIAVASTVIVLLVMKYWV